ncbi:complement C1q tumor necrosis factor-related protein 5-like [Ylistrum balloti]|uniref:complement C1q tumor necrosis factor-related protein 5-like n=1 Tax=Ylistrum balloti TaxID=509963 RepID=UPI002905E97F|nr:complement C1q tumor necrosis factor-related protein 5-like [Ylistrum balloti]
MHAVEVFTAVSFLLLGSLANIQASALPAVRLSVSDSIAFTVKAGDAHLNPGVSHPIQFQNHITNQGGYYENSTGKFLAPFSGLYMFSASLFNVYAGKKLDTDIVKNGVHTVNVYCSAWLADSACSASVVIRLEEGDHVWVEDVSGQMVHRDSTFTGVLLKRYD